MKFSIISFTFYFYETIIFYGRIRNGISIDIFHCEDLLLDIRQQFGSISLPTVGHKRIN